MVAFAHSGLSIYNLTEAKKVLTRVKNNRNCVVFVW